MILMMMTAIGKCFYLYTKYKFCKVHMKVLADFNVSKASAHQSINQFN